jgi:hypothetical protein
LHQDRFHDPGQVDDTRLPFSFGNRLDAEIAAAYPQGSQKRGLQTRANQSRATQNNASTTREDHRA